ncbi:hypothetical protein EC912_101745 [Luteibacter rhizovicinus]|uniref:Uncharacterized protein n=1 Tax=Luteibacter rhizovicinus TaxID=242606 RepID=A0A4R3Z0J4_9GAMM|nr:DUF6338 family protein [Luteibacter rhizovicinus]TCV97728.1 hypothetical protein EC912_101745 [Luteibacter rhizovicinus]
MPELSKDVVALLQYLAPGFLVAWVYFGVTSHVKPSQFERVVQALIYTVVIQALLATERSVALWLGKFKALGAWGTTSDLTASLATALFLGLIIATITNRDWLYRHLRNLGFTSRTGHPGEWFGTFSDFPRFVVLQLKDGTRVFGWPTTWPSEADKGHFFITSATRAVDDEEQDLSYLEGLLINVSDVSYVEFAKPPEGSS